MFRCKNKKKHTHGRKNLKKILDVNKIVLPLHPQNNDGGIAQLVRAHDS